jgi:hypothetical protein
MSRAGSPTTGTPGHHTRFFLRCPDCGYENPFDDYADAKAAQIRHTCPNCDRGMGVSERPASIRDENEDDDDDDRTPGVTTNPETVVESGEHRVTVDVPAPHSEGEAYHAAEAPCGVVSTTETREVDAAVLADSELDACGNCTRYHDLPDFTTEPTPIADGGRPVTPRAVGRVSEKGTAYTVIAERLNPDANPELEGAGFTSPSTLFTVLTPGEVHADYDPHRLVRQLPGEAGWLRKHLKRLDGEVREVGVSEA